MTNSYRAQVHGELKPPGFLHAQKKIESEMHSSYSINITTTKRAFKLSDHKYGKLKTAQLLGAPWDPTPLPPQARVDIHTHD